MNFKTITQTYTETAWEQQAEGWSGRMTCGAAPVQICGKVDGHPFYFRSRYQEWEFGVGQADHSVEDAVAVAVGLNEGFRRTELYEAMPFAASWMPHEEAWQIVARCIAEYRSAS